MPKDTRLKLVELKNNKVCWKKEKSLMKSGKGLISLGHKLWIRTIYSEQTFLLVRRKYRQWFLFTVDLKLTCVSGHHLELRFFHRLTQSIMLGLLSLRLFGRLEKDKLQIQVSNIILAFMWYLMSNDNISSFCFFRQSNRILPVRLKCEASNICLLKMLGQTYKVPY